MTAEDDLVRRSAERLRALRAELVENEGRHAARIAALGGEAAKSLRNFLHYLALRRHDVRDLQEDLARLGLSSLGRAEAHVASTVDAVLRALDALAQVPAVLPEIAGAPTFAEGQALLERRTRALLGPSPVGRKVHIMVTLPSDAALDGPLVRELLARGMNLARINCAHDDADVWARMVENLSRASADVGRPCRIQMDLGGPKLRTGAFAQDLVVRAADLLVLTRSPSPALPALVLAGGEVRVARVPCTLPAALDQVRAGERVFFDDGKMGGVVVSVDPEGVSVRITQAKPGGSTLRADRGINFPDSRLELPAMTDKDRDDLAVVARLADIVGLSFAQRPSDVADLENELASVGAGPVGVVLKIETRRGFEALPGLLLSAIGGRPLGVMIARGDMAVECGYERLAEIQEEMLWLCEAAHVPVVWATQVLDRLARKGLPTRAEVTDAAMSGRAECVMLNKGPYVVQAMELLDHILRRMETHQHKKSATLRPLAVSRAVA